MGRHPFERVPRRTRDPCPSAAPSSRSCCRRRARREPRRCPRSARLSRTQAFEATSSSAIPGQRTMVPGRFSRSMIAFTASAAVMFRACPELWPSPCPGAALDHRLPVDDSGHLRRSRNAVNVGTEGDDRPAFAPGGPPRRGNPRDALFDGETVGFEQLGQIALRLELLEAELREREQAVNDFLSEFLQLVDARGRFSLEPVNIGGSVASPPLSWAAPARRSRGVRRSRVAVVASLFPPSGVALRHKRQADRPSRPRRSGEAISYGPRRVAGSQRQRSCA